MELLPIVLFRISHEENDNDEVQDTRDRLLHNHRRDQQRRQLSEGYFVEARKVAYKVIIQQATEYFETPNNMGDVFAMPKMVIQCAVMEKDAVLHSLIYKASDVLLEAFKRFASYMKISSDVSAEAAVAPLLPSLLNAVCADSQVARRIAAMWASKFLPGFDMPVSLHMCSFLSTDVNSLVAAVAKKALSSYRSADVSMTDESSISFLDLSTDEGSRALQSSLDAKVMRLSDASGLSISASWIVLASCNFDAGKAQEGLECDRTNLLERAGVIARSKVTSSTTPTSVHQHGSRYLCQICYDEVEAKDTYSLACDHQFCCSCWQQHLVSTPPLSTTCPHYDCSERVAIEDVQEVAPEQVSRWKFVTTQLFVAGSREHSQCPSPDCPLVAHISNDVVGRTPSVECTRCNHRYCFSCKEEPHEPARCSDKAEWNAIFESSEFWVLKHTKRCPSCHASIEKNEGMSHFKS